MLPHLSYVADCSKTVFVIIVLLLLLLMIRYLSRVSVLPDIFGSNSSAVTWVKYTGAPQQKMLLTPNPFQVRVATGSDSTADISSGLVVPLRMCSQVSCQCVCWWGVDLRGLHALLAWPCPSFRKALLSPDPQGWPGICMDSEPLRAVQGMVEINLSVPDVLRNNCCLGKPPRLRYPLVITLLIPEDNSGNQTESSDSVVALVNVVHVRDELVPVRTSVLSQYLKQSNGQVTSLQPLYVSGISNPSGDEEHPPSRTPAARGNTAVCCVVCHYNSADLALLPCRHACLCADCLPKLTDCPLCRTRIHSYFHVVQSQDAVDDVPTVEGNLCNGQESDDSLKKRR